MDLISFTNILLQLLNVISWYFSFLNLLDFLYPDLFYKFFNRFLFVIHTYWWHLLNSLYGFLWKECFLYCWSKLYQTWLKIFTFSLFLAGIFCRPSFALVYPLWVSMEIFSCLLNFVVTMKLVFQKIKVSVLGFPFFLLYIFEQVFFNLGNRKRCRIQLSAMSEILGLVLYYLNLGMHDPRGSLMVIVIVLLFTRVLEIFWIMFSPEFTRLAFTQFYVSGLQSNDWRLLSKCIFLV